MYPIIFKPPAQVVPIGVPGQLMMPLEQNEVHDDDMSDGALEQSESVLGTKTTKPPDTALDPENSMSKLAPT